MPQNAKRSHGYALQTSTFSACSVQILRRTHSIRNVVQTRRFRSLFVFSPQTAATVWNLLNANIQKGGKPVQLLWSFLFIWHYSTEHINAKLANEDEKTYWHWCHRFVSLISDLKLVSKKLWSFPNHLIIHILQLNWECRRYKVPVFKCLICVDGTVCPVLKPSPFFTIWCSHKFKSAGVGY